MARQSIPDLQYQKKGQTVNAKRTKKRAARRILLYEGMGFFGVILLIWLSETPDLPALFFGAEKTPTNWTEIALESVVVVVLAIWVLCMTAHHINRIRYLEGFLNICASCKKIHVGDEWVMFEEYIGDRTDAVFSHGLCPECAEKFFEEGLKAEKHRNA